MVYDLVRAGAHSNVLSPSTDQATCLRGLAASAIAEQTYANAVMIQPDLTIDALADFPREQARMREHAQTFRDIVLPAIVELNTDTIDFYNTYDSYFEDLAAIARQLVAGDTSQRERFIDGIQHLARLAVEKESRASAVLLTLASHTREVMKDARAIGQAKKEFADKVLGERGELKEAQARLDELEARLHSEIIKIAASSAAAGLGIALIVVGIFTSIPSAGVTTGFVTAGLGMMGTSSLVIGVESKAYDADVKEYIHEIVTLANLQQEVGVFHCVTQQLSRLDEVAQSARDAARDLNAQWASVNTNYSTLVEGMSNQSADLSLLTQMNVAHDRWRLLADNARGCLLNLSMPTETRNSDGTIENESTADTP